MRGRGLILAAPESGSGKTLVTAGLLRHLRERGIRVAAAKTGPDYIDPTFHAAAAGGVSTNLDPWAMRPATLAGLIGALEATADIVLCEGAMGLFDGTGPDGETGSTASLARLTGWPVVLVVDARHHGASVAALVAGFARHDPELPLAVARSSVDCGFSPSPPFRAEREGPSPRGWEGEVGVGERFGIPHLTPTLSAPGGGEGVSCAPLPPLGQRIAIARDDAFLFTYPAVVEGWRRDGAELSFFSPLADETPDPAADAIYLPGGYPELHAGRLAASGLFAAELQRAASVGTPIYGECGGYIA